MPADGRDLLDVGLERKIGFDILRRRRAEPLQLRPHLIGIRVEVEFFAVMRRSEAGRLPPIDFEAVLRKIQVGNDLRTQQTTQIGGGRDTITGPHLLCDTRSADDRAALQNKNAPARAREICRRDEAVVARPDHDRIKLAHGFASCASKSSP
jgi:hypothetical protein